MDKEKAKQIICELIDDSDYVVDFRFERYVNPETDEQPKCITVGIELYKKNEKIQPEDKPLKIDIPKVDVKDIEEIGDKIVGILKEKCFL
jgi:hypothetical protein